jgi:glycosyltransferase involved in cell wall biosynthesis
MQQRAPLVSIVVPNFNYERYLDIALDSALGQTYPEMEVIVVDDGSTDGSRRVIESYGDRVRAVFKANGGQTSTCNAGFAAAHGDVVLFLDADDVLLSPTSIERMVAAMRPGVAAVQASVMTIDAEGRPLGSILPPLPDDWTPQRIRRTLRRTGNYPYPPTSGNAYARWFLERAMPVSPERAPRGFDAVLNALAPLHGEVVALREPLVGYRFHDENMGAAIELRPEKLGYYVALDLPRNELLLEEARRTGFPLSPRIVERGFYFAQHRLVSRKLRPDLHPIVGDTLSRATWRLLEAAAVAPDRPLRRALVAVWGLAVALAPRAVAQRLVALRFSSLARPPALDRMFYLLGLVRRTPAAGEPGRRRVADPAPPVHTAAPGS